MTVQFKTKNTLEKRMNYGEFEGPNYRAGGSLNAIWLLKI
jgi:hypothetical protein